MCIGRCTRGFVPHFLFSASGFFAFAAAAAAQPTHEVPSMAAMRLDGAAPTIDGVLDDAAWRNAPIASNFVQVEPHEGQPASESTEVRILYDDEALYVAFRAWDSSPDSIVAQLTRRDQASHSDRVHLIVDSYHDRRTAFHFAVNPKGVKLDLYRYDDTGEDVGWDAVWDVASQIDDEGWTAEFRIPLSQLRFSDAALQTWGINFGRDIARRGELSVWAPLSPHEQAVVSRSGELQGIRDLYPRRRIEVLPYSVARVARIPGDPANPWFKATDLTGTLGGDVKVGITSDMTLDLTVNPDFGQVEADPGQVNLTALETFLPERRPFFAEGANIFGFGIGLGDGDGGNESLFYSRRVGRAPQGKVGDEGGWVDGATQTRILAAAKLSGKAAGGWSVGVLSAVTAAEKARLVRADGFRDTRTTEPLSSYSVLRLQHDFREGSSAVGLIGTGTFRDRGQAAQLELRDRAFSGGVDGRHRFRRNTLELRGYLLGSYLIGSRQSIERAQRSATRYFQRPDADHLTLNPLSTSLTGWSGNVELQKVGGGPWRFASLTLLRSPGFEVNDLGFMSQADQIKHIGYLGYRGTEPGRWIRSWGIHANAWSGWDFGWDHTSLGGNVNGNVTFNNHWNGSGGLNLHASVLDPTLLRGGPALRTERQWNGWHGVNSDDRKSLQGSLNANWSVRPESESRHVHLSPGVRWRTSERATVRVMPFLNRREEDRQWVDEVTTADGLTYLVGRMNQTTFGVTTRLDVALSPNLTFQYYGQPFLSAGRFRRFRRVHDPRAVTYEGRFTPVPARVESAQLAADLNGDGLDEVFRNPDYSVAQFRSNAVLRWEFQPGSTLYLAWSQVRDHSSREGTFQFSTGMSDLFEEDSENVVMVKLSYWFNP